MTKGTEIDTAQTIVSVFPSCGNNVLIWTSTASALGFGPNSPAGIDSLALRFLQAEGAVRPPPDSDNHRPGAPTRFVVLQRPDATAALVTRWDPSRLCSRISTLSVRRTHPRHECRQDRAPARDRRHGPLRSPAVAPAPGFPLILLIRTLVDPRRKNPDKTKRRLRGGDRRTLRVETSLPDRRGASRLHDTLFLARPTGRRSCSISVESSFFRCERFSDILQRRFTVT